MELFRHLIGPDEGYQTMAQLSFRAVILFILGVVYIRFAGRRTFSQASPLDIIVYLIVGSNISRVMAGKAKITGNTQTLGEFVSWLDNFEFWFNIVTP